VPASILPVEPPHKVRQPYTGNRVLSVNEVALYRFIVLPCTRPFLDIKG